MTFEELYNLYCKNAKNCQECLLSTNLCNKIIIEENEKNA